jgi:transposase InsO family protein
LVATADANREHPHARPVREKSSDDCGGSNDGKDLRARQYQRKQLELATARWVEWYNQRRIHSSIWDVPPAEFESTY